MARVSGDLGETLDKALEQARTEVARLQGQSMGIKAAIPGIGNLADHIRKDFEDGKLDGLDGKSVHDLLLDWNRKAIECLANLSEAKKAEAVGAEGRVIGIKDALLLVQKRHDNDTGQIKRLTELAMAPPLDEAELKEARRGRAAGEHPGPSPLDARRQEAAKGLTGQIEQVTKPKRGRKKAVG